MKSSGFEGASAVRGLLAVVLLVAAVAALPAAGCGTTGTGPPDAGPATAAGSAANGGAGMTSVPGSPAPAVVDGATVEAAARAYLAAREAAVMPGDGRSRLADALSPGAPAAVVEPLVAAGRTALAADAGLVVVAVRTAVELTPGSVAVYAGVRPVTPGRSTADDSRRLRAVAVGACRSTLTYSDLSTATVAEDHVLQLTLQGGRWRVFDDRYAEARLAGWLRAGGAGAQLVRRAERWTAQVFQTRRLADTPVAAVRAYFSLLDERRYPEADLLLDPAFGGTAQGMGLWLKSVRVTGIDQLDAAGGRQATLRVELEVQARPSPWNDGANVRFVNLERDDMSACWRITAVDSGP